MRGARERRFTAAITYDRELLYQRARAADQVIEEPEMEGIGTAWLGEKDAHRRIVGGYRI